MHESVIAKAIVNSVLRHAEENSVQFVEIVYLKIGELAFLNPEQLLFWIRNGFQETVAQNAKVDIESIRAEIKCESCKYQGHLKMDDDAIYHYQTPIFSCPKCNKSTIDIIHGREMYIEKIQVKR